MHVEGAFDGGHDGPQVGGQAIATGRAQQGAEHTDESALHHEDSHNGQGRGTQGTQDGDIRLFVRNHHYQGGDDIEGRHRDDEGENDEHHPLLHFHGAEEIGVLAGPVVDTEGWWQPVGQFLGDTRRGKQVIELDAQTAHGIVEPEQLGPILQVNEGDATVVFVHAHLEDPHQGEATQPRQYPGGTEMGLRGDHRDLVADTGTEVPG